MGEGRRLGGSSLNGSSSGSTGGIGGFQAETQPKSRVKNDDLPPEYSRNQSSGELSLDKASGQQEGMDMDETGTETNHQNNPLRFSSGSSWSFDRNTDTHAPLQMTTTTTATHSDGDGDEDLFEDVASDKADGGGDVSDSDANLAVLGADSPVGQSGEDQRMMSVEDPPIQDIPPPLNTDDDDDLPVVELRVNDEEKIISD